MTEARRWLARLKSAHRLLQTADALWHPARGTQHASFEAWCADHAGQRCQLWLAGPGQSDLVGEPGAPLQATAACSDWARRVLAHYHGDAAASWAVLPWRRHGRWGATALHGKALADLQAQAARHGVHLVAVRALWPVLLDHLLAQRPDLRQAPSAQAWLVEAGSDQALVTCVQLAAGQVQGVHRRRLQAPWNEPLRALLDEDAAAAARPTQVLWLGAPPDQALPVSSSLQLAVQLAPPYRDLMRRAPASGPDFLHPQPRPGALAWSWLGTCVVVLSLAGWEAQASWQARAQALQVAMPAARSAVRPVARPAAEAALDSALQQRLSHPWREVFLASETPATAGLNWLTMEHQPGGDLRLQGLAADPAPVRRAAAAMRSRPAWSQVLVSRLETQPEGQSFEIVARLAPAAP